MPVSTIVIAQGDSRSVLIPVTGAVGYTGRAVAREYAAGPALQTWETRTGSMVIDSTGVHLVTKGSTSWTWRRGELDIVLTAPDGSATVAGPYRIRVRPLVSHV